MIQNNTLTDRGIAPPAQDGASHGPHAPTAQEPGEKRARSRAASRYDRGTGILTRSGAAQPPLKLRGMNLTLR
jgi:hypothetical protein